MKTAISRAVFLCFAFAGTLCAQAPRGRSGLFPEIAGAAPVKNLALQSRLAMESGNRLRDEKRYAAALLAYQGALRLQPQNANAWFYLGITYVDLDRFEEARSSFQRSVLTASDDPTKWIGLCLADYVLGDFDNTIRACHEGVRLDPKQADGWAWMGLGYVHEKQWDKAAPALEIAAALGTKSSEAWYELGLRYAREARRTKVLEVYRRLQELDPDQARRFFNVAVARKARG